MSERCPTCGSGVTIVSSGEGTSHYEPTPDFPDAGIRQAGVHIPPEWDGRAEDLAQEVIAELDRATAKFGPMASGHEAQSVIGEEFHEFTLAVWFGVDQKGRPADPRAEAIQIAAMAMRYVLDVATT